MAGMRRSWRRYWGKGKPQWAMHLKRKKVRVIELQPKRGQVSKNLSWALRPVAASVAIVSMLGVQQPIVAANQIVVDGAKTATTINVNDTITDISTNTHSSGGNIGFNAFTKFNVDPGNIVNLQLGAANSLINIVNDTQRSTIKGTLNSIKNNAIGGNVYFLNPHGLLVGTTGVINVGSFTALAPTTSYVNAFDGTNLDAWGEAVTNGALRLNENGLITVEGKINAIDNIKLQAANVTTSGALLSGAQFSATAPDFNDVVNTNGLTAGTVFTVNSAGKTEIVATTAVVGGQTLTRGGQFTVEAGDATVNGTIDTDGGQFSVEAGNAAVEGIISTGGGKVNIAAPQATIGGKVLTGGGDFAVTTAASFDNSEHGITVKENALISTRKVADAATADHGTAASIGNSGSLTLTDKISATGETAQIEVQSGSKLYSFADGSYTGGDITLTAENKTQLFNYAVTGPEAKIKIDNATLKGKNVSIMAATSNDQLIADDAAPIITWFGNPGDDSVEGDDGSAGLDINNYAEQAVDLLGNIRIGVAFMDVKAKADVAVTGATNITATGQADDASQGKVNITTDAVSTAQSMNFSSVAAVAVGISDAEAQVNIENNAQIAAANDVTIKSATTNTVALSNSSLGLIPLPFDIAVSVGSAKSDANATVGSDITAGGKVTIGSESTKTVNLSTSSSGDKDILGAAVSISLADNKVKTEVSGDITAAGNVDITAKAVSGEKSQTLAKSIIGDSWDKKQKTTLMNKTGISDLKKNLVTKVKNALGIKASTEKSALDKISEKAGFTAGFALDLHKNDVQATVKDGASIQTTGSESDVNIKADLIDRVKLSATAQQNQLTTPPDPAAGSGGSVDTKDIAMAVGIVYGQHDNIVKSTVGNAAVDTKGDLTVAANNQTPLSIDWSKLLGLSTLSANLGLQNAIFSTWAQSAADGKSTALAGSLDFLVLDNTTAASIADSAKINQETDYGAGNVNLEARSVLETTNIAGVLGGIFQSNDISRWKDNDKAWFGSAAGKAGVGGSIAGSLFFNDTQAVVGNALVKANDLAVKAETDTKNIVVSVSGGAADQLAVDVSLATADVTNSTLAQIRDGSVVNTSGNMNVEAIDNAKIIDTAGGVAKGGNTGIGASISVNTITRQTEALLGHRATETAAAKAGSLATGGDLGIKAQNGGNIISASLAAAVAAPPKPEPAPAPADGTPDDDDPLDGVSLPALFDESGSSGAAKPKSGKAVASDVAVNTITDKAYADVNNMSVTAKNADIAAKNEDDIIAAAGSTAISASGESSLGIAGTATVNAITSNAEAEIAEATITITGIAAEDVGLLLTADNKNSISSIASSGSAAPKSGGTGIAGQVTVNVVNGGTTAKVNDSTVASNKDIRLSATDDNGIVSVGGAASYGGKAGIGASVSVNVITNGNEAAINNSNVNAAGDVSVKAVETSTMTAASAAVGASKGNMAAAVSLTGSGVANTTKASVNGSTVTAKDSVLVEAADEADVIAVSGAAGISVGGTGVGGALSVVVGGNRVEAAVVNSDITALGDGDGVTTLTGIANSPVTELPTLAAIESGLRPAAATETVRGLAVAAVSQDQVINVAGGFAGGGSVGVGGSIINTTLTEDTAAYIDGQSTINADNTGAGSQQSVLVRAAKQAGSFSGAGAVGVGKSSGVGVGVDVGGSTINTNAYIDSGASVTAADSVAVNAAATEDIWSVVAAVGVGGGSAGVAGAGSVYVLSGDTNAYIGNSTAAAGAGAAVNAGGNVGISAQDNTSLNLISGGVGVGSSAGVAGALGVSVIAKSTDAYIGQYSVVQADADKNTMQAGTGSFSLSSASDPLAGLVEGYSPDINGGDKNTALLADKQSELDTAGRNKLITQDTAEVRGVAVVASSQDSLRSVVVSAGAAGTAAVTGSGAATVYDNNTNAYVGDFAQVNQSNAAAANTAQSVHIAAGSDYYQLGVAGAASGAGTAGVGGGAAVNVLLNKTDAHIGAEAKVAAKQDISVSAKAAEELVSVAAAGSVAGTAAVVGSASVSVFDLDTLAYIGKNAIVQAGNNISVKAVDDTSLVSVAGSAGIGIGGAGVGGAMNVNVFDKTTDAYVGDNAAVDALANGSGKMNISSVLDSSIAGITPVQGLAVEAVSSEDIIDVAASGAAGLYAGVSGATTVNVFTTNTKAHLDAGAKINQDSSLADGLQQTVSVVAVDQANLFSVSTSLGGGAAGVSGAVDIGLLSSNTSAAIGNSARVKAADAVAVQALSAKETDSYAVSGGAGIAGIAGSLSLYSIGAGLDSEANSNLNSGSTSVQADVDNQVQNNGVGGMLGQYSGNTSIQTANTQLNQKLGTVSVSNAVTTVIPGGTTALIADNAVIATGIIDLKAHNYLDHQAMTGGFAAGGGAVGGAVGILALANDTTASIGTGAVITAGKGLAIQASLQQNAAVDSYAAAGSLVGSLGAAVAVVSDDSDVTAFNDDSALITAGKIEYTATTNNDDIKATAVNGSVALMGAAIGASVANVGLNGSTQAYIGAGSIVNSDDYVKIKAVANNTSIAKAYGGAAGYVGLGATVALVNDASETAAFLGNAAKLEKAGGVDLIADYTGGAEVESIGAAGGFVGAGASVADAAIGGTAKAYTEDAIEVGQTVGKTVAKFAVTALNQATAKANAVAGAAGIGAGAGSSAIAKVTPVSEALIGNNASIKTTGDIKVQAIGRGLNNADADAAGISVGGLAVGASVAQAKNAPTITAGIGTGSTFNVGGNLSVTAQQDLLSDQDAANANAVAAGGGLIGVNATVANASSDATVTGYVGGDSNINVNGSALVTANTVTKQQAAATAATGGYYAAGASVAEAASAADTAAFVGNNSNVSAADVTIQATGTDDNFATTTAGSGGVVAGAAAVAKTGATGVTQAALKDGASVTANTLALNADHTTLFNATANSTNAAVVGASGIIVSQVIDTDVLAEIGKSVAVATTGDTALKAVNSSTKDWLKAEPNGDKADWNLTAAGGGVASGAAVDSDINVTHAAKVAIGDSSSIKAGSGGSVGSVKADAANNMTVRDKARINTGGAIAVADVDSRINAKGNAAVNIGSAQITSDTGKIKIGAKNNANLDNRVAADAYGVAGAPAGTAYSEFDGNNQVSIANGAKLIADNDVILAAGRDTNGTVGAVNANAVVNLWNKTVVPINRKPNPQAIITSNSTVTIDGSVGSANDIYLTADKGLMNAAYIGVGKDLYREALAEIGSAISELFGGEPVNLDIKGGSRSTGGAANVAVNSTGIVETGLKRIKTLTFGGSYEEDGKGGYHWVFDPDTIADENVTYSIERSQAIAESMTDRLNELQKLKAAYAGDTNAVAAYNAEILFLQEKMVSMGLAAWDESGGGKVFVPGVSAGTGALSPKAAAQAALEQMEDFKDTVDANVTTQTPITETAKTYRDLVAARDDANTTLTGAQSTLNDYINNTANFTASQKPTSKTDAETKKAALISGDPLIERYTQAITYYGAVTTANNNLGAAKTAITNANSSWDQNVALSTVQTAYETEQGKLAGYTAQQAAFADSISDLNALIPTLSAEVPKGPTADFITVDPITARLGDIRITADNLTGSGTFNAPGDAAITITNNSPAFLTVKDLIVRNGGSIYFNGASVKNNAAINALNTSKTGAAFSSIVTKANTPQPTVTVTSTFNPNAAENKKELMKKNADNTYSGTGQFVAVAMAPNITLAQGSTISNINGTVKVSSNSGSIYANGAISAGTVDIEAANGDFVQSYVDGFTHIGGDPAGIYKGTVVPKGITANGNIFISSRYLNINGYIQSGIADWTLTLTNDVKVSVNGVTKSLSDAQAHYQASGGTGLYTVVGGYDGNIGEKGYVTYDAVNDRFEIGGVEVHGGLVQLHGQIINTAEGGAATGKIRALDGYGTININNNSGKDIVLANLNTGDGSAGVIDITDTGRNVRTVYTSDRGDVTVTEAVGDEAPVEKANSDYNYLSSGGRGTLTYSPQSNLFYNWTTGKDYSKTTYYHYEADDVFGYTYDSSDGPEGDPTYSNYGVETPLANGIYLSTGSPNPWRSLLEGFVLGIKEADWNSRYYTDRVKTIDTGSGEYHLIKEWTKRHWYSLGITGTYYQDYSITTPKKDITTYSVQASHPIGIEFFGHNSGTVSIEGNAGNVLLQGAIDNAGGTTAISTGKAILQADSSALITTDSLTLSATGNVGSAAQAVRAIISDPLNASSTSGNVNVTQVLGDLKLGTVTAANGALRLTADGSIVNATGSDVRGQRIELTSNNGAIGSGPSAPLIIKTGNTGNYLDAGYGLKAYALNDINIENQTWSGKNDAGNLLIDTVESRTGDVKLTTPGQIVDNNTAEQIDRRTWDELTSYWDSLQLRNGTADNAAKQQQAISSYINGKNADYRTYWQLQSRIVNGQYVFADGEAAAMTAQGINPVDFAAQKVADYQKLVQAGVGTWNGGQYNTVFTYVITAEEQASLLKGSSWTERELAVSLAPGALKQLTDTNPIVKAPNAKGNNVTLQAGGGIGSNLSAIVINASTLPQDLTAEQKVALAAAERADMVINDAAKTISITQRKPVNIEAVGLLTASAGSFAYLGSEADVALNYIQANGDVRLKTAGGILTGDIAGMDNRYSISGHNIILESTDGGIGTSTIPLNLGHSGTLTARAAGNIYLYQDGEYGDMKVDTIYSLKDVSLKAANNIRSSDDNEDGLNIMSHSLQLTAGAAIGTGDKALGISVDNRTLDEAEKGQLTAAAQTGMNLSHIGDNLSIAKAATVTGDINLTAATGSMTLQQITATAGNITADAGTNLSANTLTAAGAATLSAGQNIAANNLTSNTADIIAGQDITATGIKAEDTMTMTAARNLAATTVEAINDINLTAATGSMTLQQITATAGNITADAGTNLSVNAMTALDNIDLTAGQDIHVNQIQATAGDLNLTADRSITNANNSGGINLTGSNLFLIANNGAIGTADRRMVVVIPGNVEAYTAQDIHLEARSGDLKARNLVSQKGGIELLVADGRANITRASAPSGTVILGATAGISVTDLEARALELNSSDAGGILELGRISLGQSMKLAADNISVGSIHHTGNTVPLQLEMTGGSKDLADNVNVTVSSVLGVVFTNFAADKANVKAYADNLSFLGTRIGSWADFRNNNYYVAANNLEQRLIPSDMQIMPENNPFYLTMSADRRFLTNALVINYSPDFIVNAASNDNSLVRQADKAVALNDPNSGNHSALGSSGSNLFSAGLNDGLQSPPRGNMVQMSGSPVNLGESEDDKEKQAAREK